MSINVLADPRGVEELRALGTISLPVVSRGSRWVNGQALRALADFVGVRWTHRMLAPKALAERVDSVLAAAARFSALLPPDKLAALLPSRFRSYASLCAHIGHIVAAFLDYAEHGKRLEEAAYLAPAPDDMRTPRDLADYLAGVQRRFDAWWASAGATADFAAAADVYYGEQTLHEFLERSAWHAAQHTRQLQLLLRTLGIAPDKALSMDELAGLPLPENVWDDKMAFSA